MKHKGIVLFSLLIAMVVTVSACVGGAATTVAMTAMEAMTETPTTTEAPAGTAPFAASASPLPATAAAMPPIEPAPQEPDSMKLRLRVDNTELTATLIDSPTTRDFISLLPITLTLEDYAGIEKISYLPRELSTNGAPGASDFIPGDVAYYAPWGNLAIHHNEFGYANGLVILGTIDDGKEALIVPGPVTVTIELVNEP